MKELGCYLDITNSDGKEWILPEKNIKTALNIYQPSSIKGRILKTYLPIINTIPLIKYIIHKVLHIEKCQYQISDELDRDISRIFKKSSECLSYAFFLGTPSLHQKTTIQIFCEKKVLGYCKLSKKKEIIELFWKEKQMLDFLHLKKVNGIPKCLYCGILENGYGVFIQDTIKTNNSVICHEISDKHIQFQKMLYERTKQECDYYSTDSAVTIKRLKEVLIYVEKIFHDKDRKNLSIAIKIVDEYLCKNRTFSVYHGDFTPWNSFVEKREIFVFDFEYAKSSYLPYLDLFHYFTQRAIFEKKNTVSEIMDEFLKEFSKSVYEGMFLDIRKSYLTYLLVVIEFYLSRDKGNFEKDVSHNITVWLGLVGILVNVIDD